MPEQTGKLQVNGTTIKLQHVSRYVGLMTDSIGFTSGSAGTTFTLFFPGASGR